MSSHVHEESGNENKWSYGSSQWRNTTMALSIHTWYWYNYEITHRSNFRKRSLENENTFLQLILQYPNYVGVVNPFLVGTWNSREKEFVFCAKRWHFLTPQLLASLSSNWEVQLNCCSNARWCKNFEATILNSEWCTLFSAKRGNVWIFLWNRLSSSQRY